MAARLSLEESMSQNALRFDDLPDTALITFTTVSAVTGWKRTKVFCDVRRGTFPAPLKLGRNSRWRAGDIRQYLLRLGGFS